MNQYEMKQIAYQSTLKSRALQVLVYLIDRSNKEGTCFPAISTMSRELHISVSTVKRALRELTESGFVKKESRFREKNHGQTSNLYILCFISGNEAPVEDKAEEEENDNFEASMPQEQSDVQGEKIILRKIESVEIFKSFYRKWIKRMYIKLINIVFVFFFILFWPGVGAI